MVRRQQQYLLVNEGDENNERPSLGGGGGRASSSSFSSTGRLSFSTPRRSRSSDSEGALTVSTASLEDYYSPDDDFDVEDFMPTEATDDDDDVDDKQVVDIDLAPPATGNEDYDDNDHDDDDLYVWGRTIQVQAPCALPEGYVFTVNVSNNNKNNNGRQQQLLVEVPEFGVTEGQVFTATIVHVVDASNGNDMIDYERMYNLDPATRTSQLLQQQQQKQDSKKMSNNNRNNKLHSQNRRIPRGTWRNGIFQCFEHGLFHPVLCLACWCCSPLLLGQVLTRMKLDACGNNVKNSTTNDKLQQQSTKSTSSPSTSSLFWNNPFYTMTLLLSLHIVLIEHVLSAFIMNVLNAHSDDDGGVGDEVLHHHHPTWVWILLFLRATCRCYFFVYMIYLTMKTRRRIRQKYQIRPVYCRRSSCHCPCRLRRRLHVYRSSKQQQEVAATAASDDGLVVVNDDYHHECDDDNNGAYCEDCCCATFCNCCTIMQMARHTTDYTSTRATYCTPNGL